MSDEELLGVLANLAENERHALADFLAHLAEADRRIAMRATPWPSTFEYCVKKLHYSEDEAYRRITAARAAQRHPEIYTRIRAGELTLSAISRLSPRLKAADAATLLGQAAGKSVREIEVLAAPRMKGSPPLARVRVVKRTEASSGPLFEASEASMGAAELERYQFNFEGPRELNEIINRAKELLWHKYPFGQLDGILVEWGREWMQRHDPLLKSAPRAPAALPAGPAPERVPAWARHAVWKRDGGRCVFVAGGLRCEGRRGLEMDHVVPKALGGRSLPENLRLLCRPHNDSERRRILGEGTISRSEDSGAVGRHAEPPQA